jgi:hypothetical protein
VRIRTYRQVWLQEKVIYQVERVRLPFPISLRQASLFALFAVSLGLLGSIVPGLLPPLLRYLLLPGALTWFLTRSRLDGKPPLLWLRSFLRFLCAPKRLRRLDPVPNLPGRLHYGPSIRTRLKG